MTPVSGPPRNRRPPLTLIAVAAVALVAGAGGAALATASSASSGTDSAATPTPSAPAGRPSPGNASPGGGASGPGPAFRGPAGQGAPGTGGFFAGPGGVVHGQVVVPESGGKYRTEDIQTGKVTAVSRSSLTVRSADGYTKTYQVTSATRVAGGSAGISSVKVGNQVAVTATVSGSTASLTQVTDLSLLGGGGFAPGQGGQPPTSG